MAPKSTNGTALEQFVYACIAHVKSTTKYKGIHTVFGGLNVAIKRKFGVEPIPALQAMVDQGKLALRPVKGGVLLYLPQDAPEQRDKAAELLKAVEGK